MQRNPLAQNRFDKRRGTSYLPTVNVPTRGRGPPSPPAGKQHKLKKSTCWRRRRAPAPAPTHRRGPPPPYSRAARLTLGLPCRGLPALSQPRRFAGRGRTGPCGAARRRPVGGAAGLHVGRAVGGWSERDRLGGGGGGGAPRRAGGRAGSPALSFSARGGAAAAQALLAPC